MGTLNGPAAAAGHSEISGIVHGGQQPISGATIQLYEANAATDGGASVPLGSAVTTLGDGSFTLGSYSCPTSNPLMYLLSTGGNPGLGGSVNNADIVLMAPLGLCSTLNSSQYVVINELTTVAAAQALAPFIKDGADIGSSTTNLSSIAAAFNTAMSGLVQSTGQFSSSGLPSSELQEATLADILAACVNTSGGVSGDTTPCGELLSLTGGGDTLTAAVKIALSPTKNMSSLYALIVSTPPFQPYFTGVPSDLAVTLGYPIPENARAVVLDSNGNFWVYTGGFNYNTATGMSTDLQGTLTVYNGSYVVQFTVLTGNPGAGGLYYPVSGAADKSGDVFFVNANNTISEFGPTGTAISPSGGWATGVAPSFTGTTTGVGYATNPTQVSPIRVDPQGNIWGVGPGTSNCYVELSSTGTVKTPTGTYCALSGGVNQLAPDGSGNAWTSGSSSISQVNALGALAATAPNSPGCFDPQNIAIAANINTFPYVETNTIGYDHANNQLGAHSSTGVGAITDGGTSIFCDSGAAALPVIFPYATPSSTPAGQPYSAGSLLIFSGALDGAGNFWYLTGGVAETGTVGTTSGTYNGTATFATYLNGVSPTGSLLTTYNAGSQMYGMQPTGVGLNGTGTVSNGTVGAVSLSAAVVGIDVNGTIWVEDFLSGRVIPITGVAQANTVNY